MKIIKTEAIDTEVVEDVKCDICKESCRVKMNGYDMFEYATLHSNWGYGSDHDGDKTELHFCENCVGRIGERYQIPKDELFKSND